jgi:hypothetical protein
MGERQGSKQAKVWTGGLFHLVSAETGFRGGFLDGHHCGIFGGLGTITHASIDIAMILVIL